MAKFVCSTLLMAIILHFYKLLRLSRIGNIINSMILNYYGIRHVIRQLIILRNFTLLSSGCQFQESAASRVRMAPEVIHPTIWLRQRMFLDILGYGIMTMVCVSARYYFYVPLPNAYFRLSRMIYIIHSVLALECYLSLNRFGMKIKKQNTCVWATTHSQIS